MTQIPVSIIIPTVGRKERLFATLKSIALQSVDPAEFIIIDGADEVNQIQPDELEFGLKLTVFKAQQRGAGAQRNEGLANASQPFVLFMDDDIDLEPNCIESLWQEINADERLGGCNAAITNQYYHRPGKIMRLILWLAGCPRSGSLAGLCCGTSLNFLPEKGEGSEPTEVQWLNTTCTMYRRAAMPSPAFLDFFQGYSLLEDAALSIEVGKNWGLKNVPAAKIFHDSKPANYKSQTRKRTQMEWMNRWFVMSRIQGKKGIIWSLRLAVYQLIMLLLSLRSAHGLRQFFPRLIGLISASFQIFRYGKTWNGYKQ